MEYEKIQATVVEMMQSEDLLIDEIKNIVDDPVWGTHELLVLGATIGGGFGNSETARDCLFQVCITGDFSYEEFLRFRDTPFDELGTLLSDAASETGLTSVMLGFGVGAGFSDTEAAFNYIAMLSEAANIGYSAPGPRAEYRAPLPEWLTCDTDTNIPEA